MGNNNLKTLPAAIFCLITVLWSEIQGMDDDQEIDQVHFQSTLQQEEEGQQDKKNSKKRKNDSSTDEHINPKNKKPKNSLELVKYNEIPSDTMVMIISFAVKQSHIDNLNIFKCLSEISKHWRNVLGEYWKSNPLKLMKKK